MVLEHDDICIAFKIKYDIFVLVSEVVELVKKDLIKFLLCIILLIIFSDVVYGDKIITIVIVYVLCVVALLAIIYFFIIKRVIKKENDEVIKTSLKIQELLRVNDSYDFKTIKKIKHSITQREYSRKSLDRVTGSSVIKYHIENNIDDLRTDIENAIYNISLLDKYNEEVKKIEKTDSNNESKYLLKKFKRIENRLFNRLVYKEEDFVIKLKLEVFYRSNSGNVEDNRYGKINFDELVNLYKEWQNGNKYEETKKQERKIMNDDIRYNVLKRDNYTCQICGITAKDGAKLHVDHIIPVSKGGKTVMSNLQTLCDRCNIGKSDKVNEDSDYMICPECGSKLVKRNGKYGPFIACSAYPKCHYKRK